eukprot:XP_017948977.1 PREDICTED: micronuclear linker histone polyprotein-like [Xenopus tropicalis]
MTSSEGASSAPGVEARTGETAQTPTGGAGTEATTTPSPRAAGRKRTGRRAGQTAGTTQGRPGSQGNTAQASAGGQEPQAIGECPGGQETEGQAGRCSAGRQPQETNQQAGRSERERTPTVRGRTPRTADRATRGRSRSRDGQGRSHRSGDRRERADRSQSREGRPRGRSRSSSRGRSSIVNYRGPAGGARRRSRSRQRGRSWRRERSRSFFSRRSSSDGSGRASPGVRDDRRERQRGSSSRSVTGRRQERGTRSRSRVGSQRERRQSEQRPTASGDCRSVRSGSSTTVQCAPTASGPGGGTSGREGGDSFPKSAVAAGKRRLMELVKASVAESTWVAYGKVWEEWWQLEKWAGGFKTREDRRDALVWYVIWLAEQRKSVAVVEKRMAGLAFLFKLSGVEDLTKEFIIRQAIKGFKRGKVSRDARRPISFDLLGKLQARLTQVCFSDFEARLFQTAFTLAFFGAFRVGELTSKSKTVPGGLTITDTQVDNERAVIRLRRSKTDTWGKGAVITLYRLDGGVVCPIGCLQRYMEVRPNSGTSLLIHENGSPLTRFQFGKVLRIVLQDVGEKPNDFGTHSFRIGAATEAARLGLGDDMVKKIGRWESRRFQSYVRPALLV